MRRKFFISYRRNDVKYAARSLKTALSEHFPDDEFFLDVLDLTRPGEDFVDAIRRAVPDCSAVIALIGEDWHDSFHNRPEDEPDFVKEELVLALTNEVPVLVVTMDGAPPPRASELPDSLKPLARRTATDMRYASIERDVQPLVDALNYLGNPGGAEAEKPAPVKPKSGTKKSMVLTGAALALAAGIGVAGYGFLNLGRASALPEDTVPTRDLVGWYKLKTTIGGREYCLESNNPDNGPTTGASNISICSNVSGQSWHFDPIDDEFSRLMSAFLYERGKCLEGNRLAPESLYSGAAFMNDCTGATGQAWRVAPVGQDQIKLTTQFAEDQMLCLDGRAKADSVIIRGAVHMQGCATVDSQIWTLESQ